jgi:hypothetical protein
MQDRISYITHHGQEIMVIDFSHCDPPSMLVLLEVVQRMVARHSRGSLLTLADLTGAHVDRTVATRMKEVLVHDRPYVKRSAWVGVESMPKVYYENIKSFSQRTFPTFKTREEALDWLVKE